MFGHRLELFNLFGFPVRVDASWLLLAMLIIWTLAAGYFPMLHPGWAATTYWLMGLFGALGLFAAIIIHEFAHALTARAFGLPMSGITLFLFGGVSEMEQEPTHPKVEFWTAIAGPLTSFALAIGLMLITGVGQAFNWPLPITSLLFYLAVLNGMLGVFNLLPAFPLDGGRILRSVLWRIRLQSETALLWATRITSRIGQGFALLLIVLGIFSIFNGNFIGGFWWVMIGLFLKHAATQSYEQLLLRQTLAGEPVSHLMSPDVVAVTPDLSLERLVQDYFRTSRHRDYPVVLDGQLVGHVPLNRVTAVPRREWSEHRVDEVLEPLSELDMIAPEEDAMQALAQLNKAESNPRQLLVVDGGRLLGVLSLTDLRRYLSMKMALGNQMA